MPSLTRHRPVPLALAGVALAAVVATWSPYDPAAATDACWVDAPTDLDGSGPDVVVGYPSYDLPGARDAGAIVIYSDLAPAGSSTPHAPTRRTILTADDFGLPIEAGARFGTAVATVPDGAFHVDGDGCADLFVSSPGATVDSVERAGRVDLLGGDPGGMEDGAILTFDAASLPGAGAAQNGARFGAALTVSGGVVAVGEPYRDVGGATDAGRVVRVDYQVVGPGPVVTAISQGSGAEPGDRFGEVLDSFPTGLGVLVFVGVPHEDVGAQVDAGAVALVAPDDIVDLVTQNSVGMAGSAEMGDRFGASVDGFDTFTTHPVLRLAIGVPGEDLGSRRDAGMVGWAAVDLFDSPRGISPLLGTPVAVTQSSVGVSGSAESGDRFGSAVLVGEYGTDGGRRHLVVGTPTEDVAAASDAGLVSLTRVTEDGAAMSGASPWTQNEAGTVGVAERGDRLGTALASVDLTRILDDEHVTWQVALATVPGEDVGGVSNVGVAYVGVPGAPAILLAPPFRQEGAGTGMTPMRGW